MILDLNTEFNAYLIGLLQTDGSFYEKNKNKGKISLELSIKDKDILEKIQDRLPVKSTITSRVRDTNFKNDYKSVTLNICDYDFRNSIREYLPNGYKSKLINKPRFIKENDYWRGIIDGDGSLGITKNNLPFISLTTNSEKLAIDFNKYIKKIVGVDKIINRNKRDNIYNIMLTNEKAQILVKELYYKNCLGIDRKINKSLEVIAWVRPENKKIITWDKKKWTEIEDQYILNNSLEDSVNMLGRNENSIKIRIYRLNKNN